jgi:GT2 family glycosyltransferase
MTESVVLAKADGRHVQGLMYIADSTSELAIEISGGPAQVRIKKAIITELGWLPLHSNKVVQRLLEKSFTTRLPVPSPPQGKAKARSNQQENRLQDYRRWIELFDTLGPDDVDAIKRDIDRLGYHPRFSIIMPVYNIDVKFLRAAIDSVRSQLYAPWQLCIADDASDMPDVIACLKGYQELDPRIEVIFRTENGGISAASNTALKLAQGEFVAFLDHDDVIPPHALYMVAVELNRHPDADLLYTDEDTIDADGCRSDPHFKPDWNPSLILSQNFICHLGVYRRSLLQQAGGFRIGFDGSQDYELLLRCIEQTSPERIRHIPYVLYHWRAIPGSAAHSADSKPYAWEAGRRAILEHLGRRGIKADVGRAGMAFYQVDYAQPSQLPKVSIVVPTTARLNLIKPCIISLLQGTTYADLEILVAVNQADLAVQERREFLEAAERESPVRVLAYPDRPFNFSWVNNWACAQASGSILCFMNDDVEVISPHWLEALVSRVGLDGVGAAGPLMYYPDDTIQHSGVILGPGGVADHAHRCLPRGSIGYFGRAALEQDLSCVTAGCMVVRRSVFDALGGFDERFDIAYNDVDFCIRLRKAGWRIIWTPVAELYHRESVSVGRPESPERAEKLTSELGLMRRLWSRELDRDPFYSPNLALESGRLFSPAFPPRQRPPWRFLTPGDAVPADAAGNVSCLD